MHFSSIKAFMSRVVLVRVEKQCGDLFDYYNKDLKHYSCNSKCNSDINQTGNDHSTTLSKITSI